MFRNITDGNSDGEQPHSWEAQIRAASDIFRGNATISHQDLAVGDDQVLRLQFAELLYSHCVLWARFAFVMITLGNCMNFLICAVLPITLS